MKSGAELILLGADGDILPKGLFLACYRQAYRHFDHIVIVEGASHDPSRDEGNPYAYCTGLGESRDKTHDLLMSLPDPENKLKVIFPPGHLWPGKTMMCNVALQYLREQGCDVVWHIDGDEAYHHECMDEVLAMFNDRLGNPYDAAHFYAHYFYGDAKHEVEILWSKAQWGNDIPWKRVFRIPAHGLWQSHEPPVMQNIGNRIVDRDESFSLNWKMYHYAMVSDSQAIFKSNYWNKPEYYSAYKQWKNRMTGVFDCPIIPFQGTHPEELSKWIKQYGY